MKYISYYRVSTKSQGNSGLGLDAQKSDVNKFLKNGGELIADFQDIESGKSDTRPNLLKAIEECKKQNAILLIAKLDRLSRNASFIFTLRDANIDFVCCDMPNANSVTIGIMAVLAQDERERISLRTKTALAELKKKGVKLGSPQNLTEKARNKGLSVRQEKAKSNENNRRAAILILNLKSQNYSFNKISSMLNEYNYKTSSGCFFSRTQVQRLYINEIKKVIL